MAVNAYILNASQKANLDESSECLICKDVMTKDQNLKAHNTTNEKVQHIFHEECFNRWLERNPQCPICREPLQVSHAVSVPAPAARGLPPRYVAPILQGEEAIQEARRERQRQALMMNYSDPSFVVSHSEGPCVIS